MKSVFFAIALLLAYRTLLPTVAAAQTAPPACNESLLNVDGSGTIDRPADEARVGVTIVTNANVASRSAEENTRAYNSFVASLSRLGIARDAARTMFYNVQFVPRAPEGLQPGQPQARYGYITTRNLLVTVTPLENVGKVIDAATARRVDQVGDVSFDLRDRQSAYTAALAAAMNDAKRTATTLSDAGGVHLVRIRAISAGSQGVPIQPFSSFGGSFGAAAPTATPPPTDIRPNGPVSVTAFVHVTYEIR